MTKETVFAIQEQIGGEDVYFKSYDQNTTNPALATHYKTKTIAARTAKSSTYISTKHAKIVQIDLDYTLTVTDQKPEFKVDAKWVIGSINTGMFWSYLHCVTTKNRLSRSEKDAKKFSTRADAKKRLKELVGQKSTQLKGLSNADKKKWAKFWESGPVIVTYADAKNGEKLTKLAAKRAKGKK